MKIVVIGGTGRIGSTVVNKLREHGHEAIPASPELGVNTRLRVDLSPQHKRLREGKTKGEL